MMSIYKRLLITVLASLGVGVLAIIPVVNSENGYAAGYVYFPLIFLIGIVCFVMIFAGLITITRTEGPYLLLAAVLLPVGFFGAAFVSKSLELGAYREEPMRPITPAVANKVLFKSDASHDDIERFWTHVIGYSTDDRSGHWSRPGVGGAFRPGPQNGHEVIVFSFTPSATEEQKNDVRERIRNYSPVYQLLENVDTTPAGTPVPDVDNSIPKKTAVGSPREQKMP
jgi:hypothetical protein